jgi:hypothetical protein
MRRYLIAPLCAAVLTAITPAKATTYHVLNQGGGILLGGSITTDGNSGVLAASDILSWQIFELGTNFSGVMKSIDNTNSTLVLTGGALSATTAGLVFNFASTTSSKLSFASTATAVVLGVTRPKFSLIYCDVGAACKDPFNTSFEVNLQLFSTSGGTSGTRPIGTTLIAETTPLPAAFPMSLEAQV